jgi:excisionase family DNA binding protein
MMKSNVHQLVRSQPEVAAQAATPAPLPQFLTVEELAEMMRLKRRTIYEMVSQRKIPFYKSGRRTVFELGEILKWMARHRTGLNHDAEQASTDTGDLL